MISDVFDLKTILLVPVIMVVAAISTSAILIVIKGLITGIMKAVKSLTEKKDKT